MLQLAYSLFHMWNQRCCRRWLLLHFCRNRSTNVNFLSARVIFGLFPHACFWGLRREHLGRLFQRRTDQPQRGGGGSGSEKNGLIVAFRCCRPDVCVCVCVVQKLGSSMQCEEGTDWLLELLLEVQLQQYFLRLRDELNVTRLSHFDYVKNEDLEKIGMGRPGEFPAPGQARLLGLLGFSPGEVEQAG